VSARGVANLMGRFPAVRALFSGKDMKVKADADSLIKVIPEAVSAIIAAGCGLPGDEKAEAIADTLPVESQLELVNKVLALTMPKGIGPLVDQLTALGAIVNDASAGGSKAPATK